MNDCKQQGSMDILDGLNVGEMFSIQKTMKLSRVDTTIRMSVDRSKPVHKAIADDTFTMETSIHGVRKVRYSELGISDRVLINILIMESRKV